MESTRVIGVGEAPMQVFNWHLGSSLLQPHLPSMWTFCEALFWLGMWTCPSQMSEAPFFFQHTLPPTLCLSSLAHLLVSQVGIAGLEVWKKP